MEGKYFYYPDQVPERKHAHILIHFEDGGTLVYEGCSLSLGLWSYLLLSF